MAGRSLGRWLGRGPSAVPLGRRLAVLSSRRRPGVAHCSSSNERRPAPSARPTRPSIVSLFYRLAVRRWATRHPSQPRDGCDASCEAFVPTDVPTARHRRQRICHRSRRSREEVRPHHRRGKRGRRFRLRPAAAVRRAAQRPGSPGSWQAASASPLGCDESQPRQAADGLWPSRNPRRRGSGGRRVEPRAAAFGDRALCDPMPNSVGSSAARRSVRGSSSGVSF